MNTSVSSMSFSVELDCVRFEAPDLLESLGEPRVIDWILRSCFVGDRIGLSSFTGIPWSWRLDEESRLEQETTFYYNLR